MKKRGRDASRKRRRGPRPSTRRIRRYSLVPAIPGRSSSHRRAQGPFCARRAPRSNRHSHNENALPVPTIHRHSNSSSSGRRRSRHESVSPGAPITHGFKPFMAMWRWQHFSSIQAQRLHSHPGPPFSLGGGGAVRNRKHTQNTDRLPGSPEQGAENLLQRDRGPDPRSTKGPATTLFATSIQNSSYGRE